MVDQTLRKDVQVGCSLGYLQLLRLHSFAGFFLANAEKLVVQEFECQVVDHYCIEASHQKLNSEQDQGGSNSFGRAFSEKECCQVVDPPEQDDESRVKCVVLFVGVSVLGDVLEVESIEGVKHGGKLFSFGLVNSCPSIIDEFKGDSLALLVPDEVLNRDKNSEGKESCNEV